MNKARESQGLQPGAEPAGGPSRRRRMRMKPDERREMILDGAVHFFAKYGFRAQTRALSEELNVSQALIFRYFGSKKELVEAVYQRNFMSRWRSEWESVLRDRDLSLVERLTRFYEDYLDGVDDHDWIRISVLSGLAGNALTKRYIETQVDRLLDIIADEVARHYSAAGRPLRSREEAHELVWHLHSTFIYYLFRKHVFRTRATRDRKALVAIAVENFMNGVPPAPEG